MPSVQCLEFYSTCLLGYNDNVCYSSTTNNTHNEPKKCSELLYQNELRITYEIMKTRRPECLMLRWIWMLQMALPRLFIGGFSDQSDGTQPFQKVWTFMKRYGMTSIQQKRCSFRSISLVWKGMAEWARPFGQKQNSIYLKINKIETKQNKI